MSRFRILKVGLGVSCLAAGVAAGLLIGSPAQATHTLVRGPTAPAVLVAAGKPTEFAFALSTHKVPAGLVSFKVTNRGKVMHTFKVCASTTIRTSTACTGVVTKKLLPGQSQTVSVKLTKGVHEFICTIPGHAALGMRGLLGVAVKPPTGTTTATTTTATTTTTTATTTQSTTTTHTTTTTANPDGCPPGQTIVSYGGNDNDDDEGGAPSDGDGCI
jgi:uncharacterized cupredoxin-like copper-binding protein